MRIALKSALMLTTRVIQIINPELHRHMQRTALIALTLAQRLELPDERQQTILRRAAARYRRAGDKRTIHSLDAIDNIHDPHQRQGVAMLEGLATFQPIVPFIRDHHFSPNHRGSREQHIVYFADAFERLLPADSHVAAGPRGRWWNSSSLCIGRSIRRSAISCARSLKMRTSGSTFTPAIFSGCWRLLAPSTRAIWIFTV